MLKFSQREETAILTAFLFIDLGYNHCWLLSSIRASGISHVALQLHAFQSRFLSWMEGYVSYEELYSGFPEHVFNLPHDRELINSDMVYRCRQACLFLSKAKDFDKSITSSEVKEAFINYREADKLLPQTIENDPLIVLARRMINDVFHQAVPSQGRYGPGSVYGTEFAARYSSEWRSSDALGRGFFENHDHFISSMNRCKPNESYDFFRRVSQLRSEFLLVPKDIRGNRTICRETVESQYHQQGVREAMEKSIVNHRLTSGYVNFSDQSINGGLALSSSSSLEFATLDLKDASDRISYALVESLFKDSAIWQDMVNSRSQFIDCDGESFIPNKWAPMGSAICFTTLSCVVYSLLRSMIALLGIDAEVYVYGDDIIISKSCAEAAIKVLERYGLSVNKQKSFIHSKFRESCGVDAFDGIDVTPVKLRYLPSIAGLRSAALASTCDTLHQLWGRRLYRTAWYLFALSKTWSGLKSGEGILPGDLADPYLTAPVELFHLGLRESVRVNKYQSRVASVKGFVIQDRKIKSDESETDMFYRRIYPGLKKSREQSKDITATDTKGVSVRDVGLVVKRILRPLC